MIVTPGEIQGMAVVDAEPRGDARGVFSRWFCDEEISELLGDRRIVQINFSATRDRGVIRGLHYQNPPHQEMKFVRCIKGKVWDVALDLRADSKTFLQYQTVELSSERMNMMVIPEGCAHGFQVLEPESEMLYLHTAPYAPASEAGIRYDDPKISIDWPLQITQVSERDRSHPLMENQFKGICL